MQAYYYIIVQVSLMAVTYGIIKWVHNQPKHSRKFHWNYQLGIPIFIITTFITIIAQIPSWSILTNRWMLLVMIIIFDIWPIAAGIEQMKSR